MEAEKAIIRDMWLYLKAHHDPPSIGSDACLVFWEKAAKDIGELVGGIEQIAEQHDVVISVSAHAGDGNTHPVLVLDPNDEDQQRRCQLAFGEIMSLAISLGGTISGEHGVGKLKQPWLEEQIGSDALEIGRRIKGALDPAGILNPGAIFAP